MESGRANFAQLLQWFAERRSLWRDSVLDMPVVLLFAALSTGIACEELARWQTTYFFFVCVPTAIASIVCFRKGRIGLAWCWILASLFLIGAILHARQIAHLENDNSYQLASDEWTPVVFEGTLDSVPRWRPDLLEYEKFASQGTRSQEPAEARKWQTILEVRLAEVRDLQDWHPAHGRLTVTIDGRLRHLLPGDRLRVYAKWQHIPKATNPGQFDLANYYRRKGQSVRARCETAQQVQRQRTEQWWRMDRFLGWLMERGDTAIHRYVGRYRGPLASALVLGQREQVEWEMQESLLATGTMHMLAISGMHVEMIAISIVTLALLLRAPRKGILLSTAVLVVCYGVLCGGQPPVMRAVVLVVTVCVARWLGRTTKSLNLLAMAGIVLLLSRTTNLFDVGTQLSFLAVAMLGMLSTHRVTEVEVRDPIKQLIYESRPFWQRFCVDATRFCLEMFWTSLWVWLVTTPLVLSTFHVISPIAILLNIVLWLPLLLALLSGLGLLLFGPWLPPVGWLLGRICDWNLAFIEWTIDLSERIPGSHFWLPAPSIGWTIFFYLLLLGLWSILGFARLQRQWGGWLLAAWIVLGVAGTIVDWRAPWSKREAPSLRMTFIDVGHGSCVLIQTPGGQNWLYDAGRMGDGERSFQSIASVLWHENLVTLDGLFLSHADSDHYNAMSGIAKRFWIKKFATTQQVLQHRSESLQALVQQLKHNGVSLEVWADGGTDDIDSVRFRALHPPPLGVPGSDNANSLCIACEYANRRILLTGDLESPGTQTLLSKQPLSTDVLMAPHHGSVSQDPQPLLSWCHPHWTIISGGPRAVSSKVRNAYDDRAGLVQITHRDGAIRVQITADGAMRLERWDAGRWQLVDRVEPSGPNDLEARSSLPILP